MMDVEVLEKSDLTLLTLLWDDVLFPYVLSTLNLKELFTLRVLSTECKKLVDCYLSRMKICDLSRYHKTFSTAAFSVLIKNCKQLRYLVTRNCTWLTNDMLKQIVLNNRLITHVDLSFCSNLTSPALQPIIIHLKDLTCLKLENCFWLTTGCIEAIALHHSKLEILQLDSCNVGDVQAISILLQRSQNLRELSLSGVHCVSDATMEVIAHCNKKLKVLNVNGCYQVTSYGATMVGEYCRELDYLFLSGCPITFQTLQHLRSKVRYVDCSTQDFRNHLQHNLNYAFLVHLPV